MRVVWLVLRWLYQYVRHTRSRKSTYWQKQTQLPLGIEQPRTADEESVRDQWNGDQEEGKEMWVNGVPDYICIWVLRPRELMCKRATSYMFNLRLCCCWKVSPFWSPCLGSLLRQQAADMTHFPPWEHRRGTEDSRNTGLRTCRKGKSAFTGSYTALGSRTLNPVSCRWQWPALDKLREDMRLWGR